MKYDSYMFQLDFIRLSDDYFSLHMKCVLYGKPFYYSFYKSDIWLNISDILYNIYDIWYIISDILYK